MEYRRLKSVKTITFIPSQFLTFDPNYICLRDCVSVNTSIKYNAVFELYESQVLELG